MKNAAKVISNIAQTPEYEPEAVKRLIKRLELTDKAFAMLMNVTPLTVRMWTTGAAKPCNLSRRLMQIYELYPDAISVLAGGGEEN